AWRLSPPPGTHPPRCVVRARVGRARTVPGCLMTLVRIRAICCLSLLLASSRVLAADVKLRGIAIDQRLDAPALPTVAPQAVPPIVRIALDDDAFRDATAERALARLQQLLETYAQRRLPVVVAFGAMPSAEADVEPWRKFLRTVAERSRGKVAAYQLGSIGAGRAPDVQPYAYLLKFSADLLCTVDAG